MNARRFLYQIGGIELEIEKLADEVLRTETRLTKITPVLSDMPGGGSNFDKIPDGVSDLIEWKNRLNHKIAQLMRIKNETLDVIDHLDDTRHRTILRGYYINKDSLVKLAYEMKYDYHYLVSLHKNALKEFDKHHNNS